MDDWICLNVFQHSRLMLFNRSNITKFIKDFLVTHLMSRLVEAKRFVLKSGIELLLPSKN